MANAFLEALKRQKLQQMSHQPQPLPPDLLGAMARAEGKLYDRSMIYKSLKDAFTAPVRAYRGEIDALMDPRGAMEEAMNLGGAVGVSGMAVPMKAGPGTLGMFIGPRAKTWDAGANAKALQMEAAGVDPRVIWGETGNWKAPDGHWRQEIPDNAAKLDGQSWRNLSEGQEPGVGYLDEFLNHKQLFDAYPDMRSRGMSYDEVPGLDALYNMDSQIYGMNPKAFQSGGFKIDGDTINRVTNKDSYNRAKSAILHESSHDIQKTEGWARGGSPESFGPIPFEQARRSGLIGKGLSDAQIKYELYRRLHGEAEARATQARMNMDMQQRLQTFPADSYDVPLDQLIVRYDDGPAMSTGMPVNHTGQTSVDLADSLKKKYGLEKLNVSDNGKVLEIGTMVVPRELRSQGIGTEVMNELSRHADANNLQIRLNTAVPRDGFGTTSQQRLVDFYKRFGFVENKGRNKDFEISHGMYRNQKPSAAPSRPVNAQGQPIPPTRYELAHAEAQRVAALPVEQGGLGLPANNTAMDRARAMGFDTDAYHGTPDDRIVRSRQFKNEMLGKSTRVSDAAKGHYTSNSGDVASEFIWKDGDTIGGNVLPLLLGGNRSKVYIPGDWMPGKYDDSLDLARSSGFDGLDITGVSTLGKPGDYQVSFDPKNIRSRFAAFNPAKRDSADLLASFGVPVASSSLLAYLLGGSNEAEAGNLYDYMSRE